MNQDEPQLPVSAQASEQTPVLRRVRLQKPHNPYYERISSALGMLQVILYLSLFAFVVLSFFRNTELITYQNFYHFFKDLNASAETVDVFNADSVSYPTADEQDFTLYRQGLAVAGNHSVSVFTATGRQTLSAQVQYRHPVAVGAGKYLLVYELGGSQYSIYNSYTQLYTGKSDYPITGAAVSDAGLYAIVSSSETYTSVVSLYNEHFSLINRYNKNGYVMDVSINEKGSLLSILTSQSKNGLFSTELMVCEPKKTEALVQKELASSLGLSCAFTKGGVSVLCTDEMLLVSEQGALLASYSLPPGSLSGVVNSEDGIVLYIKATSVLEESRLLAFDENGKLICNELIEDELLQLSRVGDSLFYTTPSSVVRKNLRDGTVDVHSVDTGQKQMLAVEHNMILLCSPQKAVYIKF